MTKQLCLPRVYKSITFDTLPHLILYRYMYKCICKHMNIQITKYLCLLNKVSLFTISLRRYSERNDRIIWPNDAIITRSTKDAVFFNNRFFL